MLVTIEPTKFATTSALSRRPTRFAWRRSLPVKRATRKDRRYNGLQSRREAMFATCLICQGVDPKLRRCPFRQRVLLRRSAGCLLSSNIPTLTLAGSAWSSLCLSGFHPIMNLIYGLRQLLKAKIVFHKYLAASGKYLKGLFETLSHGRRSA